MQAKPKHHPVFLIASSCGPDLAVVAVSGWAVVDGESRSWGKHQPLSVPNSRDLGICQKRKAVTTASRLPDCVEEDNQVARKLCVSIPFGAKVPCQTCADPQFGAEQLAVTQLRASGAGAVGCGCLPLLFDFESARIDSIPRTSHL